MFQGSSALTLDAKGRMSIPTRYRDPLISEQEGRLTLTRHPDGCLLLYPRSVWETKREQIAALPMSARAFQRLLLGSAHDVEMDSAGRILITAELRQAATLEREAMLLGMGGHFEIWHPTQLDERQKEDLAKSMTDVFEQFSF
ncbi:MAG TPA: division/cell wall cluster transcriptional repressor MraZ [Paenalcaligenes sp.]|nr:division/cell wall cluster transcriptional repressor MraZ [Paenalcaligenes sp.]